MNKRSKKDVRGWVSEAVQWSEERMNSRGCDAGSVMISYSGGGLRHSLEQIFVVTCHGQLADDEPCNTHEKEFKMTNI